MSLHAELLTTARYLLRRNNNRPSPADIRRAVSTAYYALFHRLIDAAVTRLLLTPEQQAVLARSFDHGRMKAACQAVRRRPLPALVASWLGGAAAAELDRIAEVFEFLQQRRHEADYNKAAGAATREAAQAALGQVEDAFADMAAVEPTPAGQAFLLLLLLGEPKAR